MIYIILLFNTPTHNITLNICVQLGRDKCHLNMVHVWSALFVFLWLLSNDQNYNNDALCPAVTIYAFYCFSCIVGVCHATLVALTTNQINQTIKICNNYIHNVAFTNADTWKIQLCDVAWKKIHSIIGRLCFRGTLRITYTLGTAKQRDQRIDFSNATQQE